MTLRGLHPTACAKRDAGGERSAAKALQQKGCCWPPLVAKLIGMKSLSGGSACLGLTTSFHSDSSSLQTKDLQTWVARSRQQKRMQQRWLLPVLCQAAWWKGMVSCSSNIQMLRWGSSHMMFLPHSFRWKATVRNSFFSDLQFTPKEASEDERKAPRKVWSHSGMGTTNAKNNAAPVQKSALEA